MSDGPDSDGDPFEGLEFGDAYDELAGRRTQSHRARRPHRRFFRRLRRAASYLPLLLIVSLVAGAAWRMQSSPNRPAAPWQSGPATARAWTFSGDRPTPSPATTMQPLGRPTRPPSTGGPHLFIATQPGSSEPIAYDPCRRIFVVVNPRSAPDKAGELLDEALAEISAHSGLQFTVEGTTDEVPVDQRPPFQRERYGDRWAPVLVAWSDPVERPDLAGVVAGIGGSLRIQVSPTAAEAYVSGAVTLDGPQLGEILRRRNGRALARSVVMHELGHVVGLDHVGDRTQLMSGQGRPSVTRFQDGDIAGLNRLGSGRCFERL